jgi:hypothetical protein
MLVQTNFGCAPAFSLANGEVIPGDAPTAKNLEADQLL